MALIGDTTITTDGSKLQSPCLLTDGAWSSPDGTVTLSPASENPSLTAADLHKNQGVDTYVIAIAADSQAEAAANEVASAGGTTAAYLGGDATLAESAIQSALADIRANATLSCP